MPRRSTRALVSPPPQMRGWRAMACWDGGSAPEGDAVAAGSDDVEGAGGDLDLLSVAVPEAQQRVRMRR